MALPSSPLYRVVTYKKIGKRLNKEKKLRGSIDPLREKKNEEEKEKNTRIFITSLGRVITMQMFQRIVFYTRSLLENEFFFLFSCAAALLLIDGTS